LLKLRITIPNAGSYDYNLSSNQSYIIGRDPDNCQIVIADDKVSKQHARIDISENLKVTITDLGSTNGTKVNKEPVIDSATLKHNSIITIGLSQLTLLNGNEKTGVFGK
jgi:pSer/pThr/pTyr-binding forkhead associated (FHA) protein